MKHALGRQPRERMPVAAMAVDEQLIVAGQGMRRLKRPADPAAL